MVIRFDDENAILSAEGIKNKKGTGTNTFMETLKAERRNMTPRQRERSKNIVPATWLYPWAIEKQYERWIRSIMKRFTTLANQQIRPFLSIWVQEQKALYDSAEDRQDAWERDLALVTGSLYALDRLIFEENEDNTLAMISGFGFAIDGFNRKQWNRQTTRILGTPYLAPEPWRQPAINAWSRRNFTLVRSLEQRYITNLNTLVSDAIQNNVGWRDVQRQINGLNRNLTGWQSERLARDQTGKLNGRLTEERQQEIGVDTYIWSTAADERVRGNPSGPYKSAVPSHYEMSQKICRWDDPTKYWNGKSWINRVGKMPKVHPGSAILCRCVGLANWAPLLEQADQELEREAA